MAPSPSGHPALSFRLTRAQRLRWAIGSMPRAVAFLAALAFVSWLGLVSIGWVAPAVVVALALFGHWVPYALAGRHRLRIDGIGITDHTRFRTRTYEWRRVAFVQADSLGSGLHGVVVAVPAGRPELPPSSRNASETMVSAALDAEADFDGEFLRSGWRPSRSEVDELIEQIQSAGWIDAGGQPASTPD